MADDQTTNTDCSGGTRYSKGKPGGFWFAPLYGLRLVAEVWTAGARKYSPLDWAAGQNFSTLLDCTFRHLLEAAHHGPLARDADTGALHVACACWNLLCLLTFIALGRVDVDDVTPWHDVTAGQARAYGWAWPDAPPPAAASHAPLTQGGSSDAVGLSPESRQDARAGGRAPSRKRARRAASQRPRA